MSLVNIVNCQKITGNEKVKNRFFCTCTTLMIEYDYIRCKFGKQGPAKCKQSRGLNVNISVKLRWVLYVIIREGRISQLLSGHSTSVRAWLFFFCCGKTTVSFIALLVMVILGLITSAAVCRVHCRSLHGVLICVQQQPVIQCRRQLTAAASRLDNNNVCT